MDLKSNLLKQNLDMQKANFLFSYMLSDELQRFLNEINTDNNKTNHVKITSFSRLLFSLFVKKELSRFKV